MGCRDDSEVIAFENLQLRALGIDIANETSKIKKIPAELIDEHFDENSYDICYASHSLEHVIVPEKVLENIRKISKNGCYVILPLEKGSRASQAGHDHPVVFDISVKSESFINDKANKAAIDAMIDKDFQQFKPYKVLHVNASSYISKVSGEVHIVFEWVHFLPK